MSLSSNIPIDIHFPKAFECVKSVQISFWLILVSSSFHCKLLEHLRPNQSMKVIYSCQSENKLPCFWLGIPYTFLKGQMEQSTRTKDSTNPVKENKRENEKKKKTSQCPHRLLFLVFLKLNVCSSVSLAIPSGTTVILRLKEIWWWFLNNLKQRGLPHFLKQFEIGNQYCKI